MGFTGRTVFCGALAALVQLSNVSAATEEAEIPECAPGAKDIGVYGLQPLAEPPAIRSRNGELTIVLDVKYGTYEIAGCTIRHRSYNGQPMGPTLRLKPGTFWYHPHVHGSTAIQVSSGMGGALLIEGGLDDVPKIAAASEQLIMFQQVPYDERGAIEDFKHMGGPAWLEDLKRHVTINGQLVPVIEMRPGEVQRWRLIHGGVKIPLDLILDGHKLYEIATDGMALGKCDAWNRHRIHSGYRSDVLVKAELLPDGETRAEYWLRDEFQIERKGHDSREYLAKIVVSGEPLDMHLPCSEGQLADLVPFAPIANGEIEGEQTAVFSIIGAGDGEPIFAIDGKPFGEGEVRTLKLGSADEWIVSTAPDSLAPTHPFHIHVNPFQMTRIDPDGNPEIIWKDTLAIERGKPEKLRMRYKRFKGRFVLHCHFLDHEDRGMMQSVEIVE